MPFTKHGTGEILPEEEDGQRKTAADTTTFDEEDQAELEQENKKADR